MFESFIMDGNGNKLGGMLPYHEPDIKKCALEVLKTIENELKEEYHSYLYYEEVLNTASEYLKIINFKKIEEGDYAKDCNTY